MGRLPAPAVLALVAALAAPSAGCAYLPWHHWPWESGNDWEIARSKRFTIYARAGADSAATTFTLEQSYALLRAAFFTTPPPPPIEVLLVDWPDLRGLLGTQRTGATIAELPGRPLYGRSGLVVMYAGDTTTAGAVHRLAHLFLHAMAPRAPLWLHEGLASYFETAVFHEDARAPSVCTGQLPQKQADLPLADLFALSWAGFDDAGRDPAGAAAGGGDPKQAPRSESKQASSYRFTASSVIDYFLMGDGGKLRDKFGDLVAALADGETTEAALAKVFPTLPPAVLQEKVREHRKASETSLRGLCPISSPVPAERFADSAKTRKSEVPQEELERLLLSLRMLPRRDGQVDWYPPAMIGVQGGQFPKPAGAK